MLKYTHLMPHALLSIPCQTVQFIFIISYHHLRFTPLKKAFFVWHHDPIVLFVLEYLDLVSVT